MLTVGVDSYVSLSEAENYIKDNVLSDRESCKAWSVQSDEHKEILLKNACADIQSQIFSGKKLDSGQKLAFPRVRFDKVSDDETIKSAQIEQALFINTSAFADFESRRALVLQGVKSFSLGDLSESYGESAAASGATPALAPKSRSLLAEWLGGGYRVR